MVFQTFYIKFLSAIIVNTFQVDEVDSVLDANTGIYTAGVDGKYRKKITI